MSLSSATTSAIWSDATHGASSPVEDDFAAGVATTGVASVRGKTLGKIETAGDADWFAVTLEAGVRYQFVADTLIAPFGAAALGNPRLRLLDADGKLVASDDNSFIGTDALIQFTPATSGRWFVEVSASSTPPGTNPVTGNYALIVQADSGRNKPSEIVSYTLEGNRLEVIFDTPIQSVSWHDTVLAQRGSGASLAPIGIQGAPELDGRSIIFNLSEALGPNEYVLLRGAALPSPRVITAFDSFDLFDDTTSSLILGGDGNTVIDVSALTGEVDILDLGGNNRFITGTKAHVSIVAGAGNDQYQIARPDTPIQDLGGTDTATVLASNTKLPSDIETVSYAAGVKSLPYWISALVADEGAGDRFRRLLGDDLTYAYAFPPSPPDYLDSAYTDGFQPFTAAQAARAVEAMALIAASTAVRFIAAGNAAADDTLAFALNHQTRSGGYAIHPRGGWLGSDVFLNVDTVGKTSLADGTYGAYALTHEIGHALGLKHPFSAPDAGGEVAEAPYLSAAEDTSTFTVMSYTLLNEDRAVRIGPLDIAALQYLYGPNPEVRAGDDRYTVSSIAPNFIWDGGGVDSIDLSSLDQAANVSLEPGDWGFIGSAAAGVITAPGQITVNFGTAIENLFGSGFSDTLRGNALANLIRGGAGGDTIDGSSGNDTLYGGDGRDRLSGGDGSDLIAGGADSDTLIGGDGIDIARFDSASSNWRVYASPDLGEQALVNRFTGEIDRLQSIETLQFSDRSRSIASLTNTGKWLKESADFPGAADTANVASTALNGTLWTGALTPGDVDTLRITVPPGYRLTEARIVDLVSASGSMNWSVRSLATGASEPIASGSLRVGERGSQPLVQSLPPGNYLLQLGDAASATTADYAVELGMVRANTRPSGSLAVTGTLRAGELLSVSNTLADVDGMPASGAAGAIRYQWRLNGAAIAGATESTYRLTAADVAGRVSVSAIYTDLGGTQETASSAPSAVVLANPAPASTYAALPRVRIDTTLGNLVVELESDRAPVTVSNFLKYVNANFYDGTEFHRIISTFMAQGGGYDFVGGNFVPKSPLFSPIALERTSTTGLSNLTGTLAMARTSVANSATSEFFINLVDNLFLDAAGASDGNGYAVFGRVVSGGPAVMAELKKVPVVDNGAGEVSKPTVPVTLTDVVSVDLPTNAPPSGSVVIAGIPIQGRTLVARSLLSDADGIPASGQPGALSYYWKANGEMIPGAFASSLTLSQSMVGKSITAVASYTDLQGVSGYVASAPVKVIDANDFPSGRITVSGTPVPGATLTASSSLVDLDGIPAAGQSGALRWQWNVDGAPVAGMTQSTYAVGAADAGKAITVTASYTDLAGTFESVTSAAAGAFAPTPAPALPRAWLRTNYGDLLIELEATRAASTVANFVQYVKSGFYNSTVFHRVIDGFMVQGGGYTIGTSGQYAYKTPTQPAIALQRTSDTGLSNTFGTVAMARTSDPNSATSQFFINVADNLFLNADPSTNRDGYAVFGRVVDGYATLDLLASVPVRANGGEVSSPTVAIGIVGSYYDPKPAGGDVFVTGQPIQGQTLTAQHTLTDPDGLTSAGLLGWVWRADGVPVTGVTSSATLLLTQAHVGREMSVEAVYRDNAGNIGYVASSPTAEVGLAIDSRADLAGVLASAGGVGARGAAVTGSTYHWNSHILLEDVQVATQAALVSAGTGAGAPKAPAADTSADGRWTVDSLDFDVLLRVSASRAVDPGEAARAINAADVLAALKLANGRAPNPTQGETGTASLPLSPYQVIAADINRDGKVTTDDALGILKIAVGAGDSPAPVWRFAAESETLWNAATGSVYTRQSVSTSDGAASAKSGQEKPINLVGVLTGDVDGSWRPGSAEALPAGGYDQLPLEYFQSLGLTPEALAQFGIAMV